MKKGPFRVGIEAEQTLDRSAPATYSIPMTGPASHDRHGSNAGRGFRFQDAVAAWLAVRVWVGADEPASIIPEGNDDIERRGAKGSGLVQVKSRREHMGDTPIAMSCPRPSGPSTMIVWITKGTTNAEQEAQAGGDHWQAA